MTNHPTGDTALSRAITTGAPVATNDAQAAELTQRFKVGDRVKWKTLDDRFGSVRRVLSGEYMTVAWDGAIDAIEHAGNLELAPTPTPRPTPGGEWKARKSLDVFIVEKDKEDIWLRFEEDANFLVRRLNAADAMEKALTRIALVSNDRVVQALANATLQSGKP